MNSYNLKMCGIWMTGSPLYDNRTELQQRAADDRLRDGRAERENKVLRKTDLTKDGLEKLHFYPLTGGHETYS